jgi:hypothetical protein
MVAGDGSVTAEVVLLKDEVTAFADNVKCPSPTSRTENWLAYQHTICKTMEFPMLATDISEDDWDSIFWIINKATLPKCRLVGSFNKAVLYGPRKYQGMGGPMEPLHHQGLQKLCTFVHQVNQNTTCGQHIQITTEQLRLETGYPGPFTDVPYSSVGPCATPSWIKSL